MELYMLSEVRLEFFEIFTKPTYLSKAKNQMDIWNLQVLKVARSTGYLPAIVQQTDKKSTPWLHANRLSTYIYLGLSHCGSRIQ